MKKVLLIAVLILASIFYIAQTTFAEVGFFDTGGYIFSGKEVQENLYKDANGEVVTPLEVEAQDKIYERGSSVFVGEDKKVQFNTVYPMYINDGVAVRLLEGTETLLTPDFERISGYKGLIVNNGVAYNEGYERADWNEYILIKLKNNLYVNAQNMKVKTFLNDKSVPVNSIAYYTPDFIRYYYYDEGKFKSEVIEDVDYQSMIQIGSLQLSYYDFLLALGEISLESEHKGGAAETDDKEESELEEGDSGAARKPEPAKPAEKAEDASQVLPPAQTPELPEEPKAPEDSESAGTGNKDENLQIKIPDWEMPEVVTEGEIIPGIYTLKNQVTVNDPAGVIVGGLTYEIVRNDETNHGVLYKRTAVTITGTVVDVSIAGLQPEQHYIVRGYFKYKDKYGRIVKEYVTFLEDTPFTTKSVDELGEIVFEDFRLDTATIYENRVHIPNFKFDESSDMDAVGSLSRVLVRFTTEGQEAVGNVFSEKKLESLKGMQAVNYISSQELKSNTVYDVEIRCYDRHGNLLNARGNTVRIRTCKSVPKAKISVDTSTTGIVKITAKITNKDNLEYKNLRLQITDSLGNIVNIGGESSVPIEPDKEVKITDLGDNKSYTAIILCDCDINDGKGEQTIQIGQAGFVSSSLSKLGNLNLTLNNITDTVDPDNAHQRALLTLKINDEKTNPELPAFIDILTLHLAETSETVSISLNDEQLETLKAGGEVTLDTGDYVDKLKSNTTYRVSFETYSVMEDEKIKIKTVSSLSSISTPRQPVRIEMRNVQGYTGYITAEVKVTDIDDFIEGQYAILQVRKPQGTSDVVIGAFDIKKNSSDFVEIKMFKDGGNSSDGISYDIEGGIDYLFRFVAEEANTPQGLKTNYVLLEKNVSTSVGVEGNIYLKQLQQSADANDKYTAKVLVDIKDDEEWLIGKTVYVDIYKETVMGSSLIETKELKYEGTGTGSTPMEFTFDVDKEKKDNVSYNLNLYIKPIVISSEIQLQLDTASFTAEEPIYYIETGEQFASLGTSDKKYVVICDISYDNQNGYYQHGPWKKTAFKGKVDFQGFAFDLKGNNVFMWQLDPGGVIENMILRNHVTMDPYVDKAAENDAGIFVYNNYGTISNIKIEYSEDPYPYRYDSYWSTMSPEELHAIEIVAPEEAAKYKYQYKRYNSALCSANYGIIENFVIEVKTEVTSSYRMGLVAQSNSYKIRNGYVYGSDAEKNYRAQISLYVDVENRVDKNSGVVAGMNVSGGIIENVFALADIHGVQNITYTGILAGSNNSIVRNSYGVGNLTYGTNTEATVQGPVIGGDAKGGGNSGYLIDNVYYISDYGYNNVKNEYASVIALRAKSWQAGILNNSSGNKAFNVDTLIASGCYPQLNYTSAVMPAQEYIPLPEMAAKTETDLILSHVYEEDADNPLNDLLKLHMEGDEVWDLPDDKGRTSHSQVGVLYFSDRNARQVYSVDVDGVDEWILGQHMDGSGVTVVYVAFKDPVKALSQYQIKSVTFEDYAGNQGTTYSLTDRYVNISYYWRVTGISGNDSWEKVNKKPEENFRLCADLDFQGEDPKKVFVSSTFSGEVDGAGYAIKNVEYFSGLNNNIGRVDAGIFKNIIKGKVYDLTLENINFEGGERSGILAGYASLASIENVYVNKGYVSAGYIAGGLVGTAELSSFANCGVTDVKVINSAGNSNGNLYTGGFAGHISGASEVTRCFTDNVYVESMLVSDNEATGGFAGYINGTASIRGCYATGVVHGNSDAVGGFAGMLANTALVSEVYADTDVFAYNGNGGGLIGYSLSTMTDIGGISFGNVASGIIMESNDYRRGLYDMVCISDQVSGAYYTGATLTLDNSGKNYAKVLPGKASFGYDLYVTGFTFDYLNTSYFSSEGMSEGKLPKLIDGEGKLLPQQRDRYIDEVSGEVSVNNITTVHNSDGTYNISVEVTHPADYRIEKVYTDYTYVDDYVGLEDGEGINSYPSHVALTAIKETYTRSQGRTVYNMSGASPESYYDIYRVTVLRYTDSDGKTGYIKVNKNLDIDQQFKEIANINDWKKYVYGSHGENFKITGDIDFANEKSLRYHDELSVNNLVCRLVGTKGTKEDFDDIKGDNGTNPYHTIKNADVNATNGYMNTATGWHYQHSIGLIRHAFGECSNITFDNVTVTGARARVGVIGSATGKISGVIFKNCKVDIKGGNNSNSGMIGIQKGYSENIYIKDIEVLAGSSSGAFTGQYRTAKFTYAGLRIAKNIHAEGCTIKAGHNNVHAHGGLIGVLYPASWNFIGSEVNLIDGCTVTDTTVESKGDAVGGLTGRNQGRVMIDNCLVIDSVVKTIDSKTYVGGIVGRSDVEEGRVEDTVVNNCEITGGNRVGGVAGDCDGTTLSRCYVYQCEVVAKNDMAGGISGRGEVRWQCVVEQSTIVAKARAGGITGWFNKNRWNNSTLSYGDGDDFAGWTIDCNIYAEDIAGGAIGHTNQRADCYYVQRCEIRGNQLVGGIAGQVGGSGVFIEGYVEDSLITTLTDDIAAEYGLTNSPGSFFGGVGGSASDNIQYCMVDNCIIGAENVDNVGGIAGRFVVPKTTSTYFNIAKDSVVIGDSNVGGFMGLVWPEAYNSTGTRFMAHSQSNCLVAGNENVGGIAGKLEINQSGADINGVIHYNPIPFANELFFTGAIIGKNNASAIYGAVDGMTTSMTLAKDVSIPAYIDAPAAYPLIGEGGTYKIADFAENTAELRVSLWEGTEIRNNGIKRTTMKTILESDLYSSYIGKVNVVNANQAKGVAGDPFINTFTDTENLVKKLYADGMRSSGWFAAAPEGMVPFTRSNVSNKIIIYNGITYSRVNPITGEEITITTQQGTYIPGTENYNINLAKMEAMYEAFINGGGKNTLRGAASSALMSLRAPATEPEEGIESLINIYSSDFDKINIELEQEFFNYASEAELTLYIEDSTGGDVLVIDKLKVDKNTYTLNYNYTDQLKVIVDYTDLSGEADKVEVFVKGEDLTQKAMLYNGEGYYISGGGIFRSSTQEEAVPGEFIHLYNGMALNSAGYVTDVTTGTIADEPVTTGLCEEVKSIHTFDYNGNKIQTYGTYSVVGTGQETGISNDRKLYVKSGKLIAVDKSINPAYEGVFAYYEGDDSYLLVLTKEGKLRSLGSVALLDRLQNFNNGEIKALTHNFNSSGTTVILTYEDGTIVGYDVKTGHEVFRTEALTKPTLMKYMSFFSSRFLGNNDSETSQDRSDADKVIQVMEESELSLGEVVSLVGEDHKAYEGLTAEEIVEQFSIENKEAMNQDSIMKGNNGERYITVFNEDREEFEIYAVDEILSNPQEAVAETEKIIDKSSLRAMYKALSEGEDDERNGIALYALIVLVIVSLLSLAVLSVKKHGTKTN